MKGSKVFHVSKRGPKGTSTDDNPEENVLDDNSNDDSAVKPPHPLNQLWRLYQQTYFR